MRLGVLGPAECWRGEDRVDLGPAKQRAIVAALALARGRRLSADALADAIWGDDPPPEATTSLHTYIARLRRILEPDRPPRTPATMLTTVAGGYALRTSQLRIDAVEFETAVTSTRRALGSKLVLGASPLDAARLDELSDRLDAGLDLWRGEPYADLGDHDGAVAERLRLEDLRVIALEDRVVIALHLGEHATAAAELDVLTNEYPLHERFWGLKAIGLIRAGRQADALEALERVCRILDEDLGLEPSPELRKLQTMVLRQDEALAWVPPEGSRIPAMTTAYSGLDGGHVVTDRVERIGPARIDRDRPDPDTPTPEPPTTESPTTEQPGAERPVHAVPVADFRSRLPGWPLAGRGSELSALTAGLRRSLTGTTVFAVLTGEPGIGKTRLCQELAVVAEEAGVRIAVGRCSQDDGAPALWPWRAVLSALDEELEVTTDGDDGAAFRTWSWIIEQVVAQAECRPVLLMLDDLHWADPATLRTLHLLIESVPDTRLMIVLTLRSHPEPAGHLGDVIESLARRQADRVQLTGLSPQAATELVSSIADFEPTAQRAADLTARADGNPFFIVEFARLAASTGDLDALLHNPIPPRAVHDVVRRRLGRLPAETTAVLREASVVGRAFDVDALAAASQHSPDALIDLLDPAVAAGLVRETGVEEWVFTHALVRDTAYADLGASRAARTHARVAAALAESGRRETEVAHHWLAAGPRHARAAWRSCLDAADVALLSHAHDQAADQLTRGRAMQRIDPEVSYADELKLLMRLAHAQRQIGNWVALLATVEEAIAVADGAGDIVALAEAASIVGVDALWTSAEEGSHDVVVDALHRALDALPVTDSPIRCRALLALAMETMHTAEFAERAALIDAAGEIADRLQDPSLIVSSCQVGFLALWQPDTISRRIALARKGLTVAEEVADDAGAAVSGTLLAIALAEAGDPDQMWRVAARARERAECLQLPYPLLILDTLEIPWLAMSDRLDEAEARHRHLQELTERFPVYDAGEALAAARIGLALWGGGLEKDLDDIVEALEADSFPLVSLAGQVLVRAGRTDDARGVLARVHDLPDARSPAAVSTWGAAAELAAVCRDARLGAAAYAVLTPLSGGSVSLRTNLAMGPVDAFLALAAHAIGDLHTAAQHADAARIAIREWRIPAVGRWFERTLAMLAG